MKGETHKYHSLDGLRGLAALAVVLLHYVTAFAPFLIGYLATQRHTGFDQLISTTPLQLPLAGNFAVCVFFVLSGFVLSISFFKHKTVDVLISSASRRYFRLMIPALGSVILTYVILSLGLMHNQQAAPLSESAWLSSFWAFPANLIYAVYQGLYGAFFTIFDSPWVSYNPVLWTMHFELFGSFLVFMFLALFGKIKNRAVFYIALSLVFLNSYYLAFIIGMAIADIFLNRPDIKNAIRERVLWALLPVGLILGAWNTDSIYRNFYSAIELPFFSAGELQVFAHIIGASIVILCVLRLNFLSRMFETRPMQYLGRISFSLYLTHFVIMGSVGCFLFAHLVPHVGYKAGLLLTFVPSMLITFGVASIYTRLVDIPSISLSKRLGNMLMNGDLLSLKPFRQISSIAKKPRRPAMSSEMDEAA